MTLPTLIEQLATAVAAEDPIQIVEMAGKLVEAIAASIAALDTIGVELGNLGGVLPGVSASDLGAFAAQLSEGLLDYLVVTYLDGYYPRLKAVLAVVGIVEVTVGNEGSHSILRSRLFYRRTLHLERTPALLQRRRRRSCDPSTAGGDPSFDGRLLLERIRDVFYAFAVPALYKLPTPTAPPSLRVLLFTLSPKSTLTPPGLELAMELGLAAGLDVSFPFFIDGWSIQVAGDSALQTGLAIDVTPPGNLAVTPPSGGGGVDGNLWLRLVAAPVAPRTSLPLFGAAGAVDVQAGGMSLGLGTSFAGNAGAGAAELQLEGKVDHGQVVIGASQADGFLATLLPAGGLSK